VKSRIAMKIIRNIFIVAIFLMAFAMRVFAATEVTSITASPEIKTGVRDVLFFMMPV
jgi:hypothetical protein